VILIETHKVKNNIAKIRFQEYAVGIFNTIPTKSGIKKAIKKKLILIDKEMATTAKYITGGEHIELFEAEESVNYSRLKLTLEVIFEDDYLAIINKPAGVLVSGNKFVTIANALSQNLKKSTQLDAVNPKPVHRLDYPTSGLLVVGKTSTAILKLNKLFEEKKIQKTYLAITIGQMNAKGFINSLVDNKTAFSEYTVLKSVKSERFNYLNLVKLTPKTGRKHQLRKHLLSIKNPILGDKDYFIEDKVLKGKGLFLHASALNFTHPFSKKDFSITIDLPKKFLKIFNPQEK